MNLTGYSQKVVLNSNGDTTICFSIDQAKFLLKEHYRADRNDTLLSLCELQIELQDSIVRNDQVQFSRYEQIINNNREVVKLKDYQIEKLEEQVRADQKMIRRQKLFKWLAVGAGSLGTGLMGFLWITGK